MDSNATYYPSLFEERADRRFGTALLLTFLLWPFGSLLIALYHYNRKEAHTIFILFTGLYGYLMVADSAGLDLYRILRSLEVYSGLSTGELFKAVGGIYSQDPESSVDIYRDLVTFLVSRVTSNGSILTLTFGLIYGWLFVKSISIFIDQINGKGYVVTLLIFCFSFIFPLDQLAGVRYATAAYLFFAGTIKFLETQDKRYLLLVALTPLIHFAFLSLVVALVMYLILKKRAVFVYIILLVSFILSGLIEGYVSQTSSLFGGAIEQRTNMYLYQKELMGNNPARLAWYIRYREEYMYYFAIAVLALSRLLFRRLQSTVFAESVFLISLLILSLVNFTINIPHAGYRYQFVFIMFVIFYLFLLYINNSSNKMIRVFTLMVGPAFFFQIIYGLRNVLATSSPMLFFGNFLSFFITDYNQSLWSILFNK